ncbi:hypothetical protein P4284_16045 [Bacillus swezeyi]|uniref:hypothetical protein n=1 Tax=Bacillus swezeyi TaxID=1925020 RepID=UPI002E23B54A|nr:hypothetical protein [Bacillus swezeyi]
MLFKSKKPNVIVWDKENDKPLAAFKNGIFETEDQAVTKKLKANGYEGEKAAKDDK